VYQVGNNKKVIDIDTGIFVNCNW